MFSYTTNDVAYMANVAPSTIRATLSRKGNFLGIKPIRLHNGRLLWPAEEVDRALHTYRFIEPWSGRKVQDIGEARAFVQAVATALENQQNYIRAQARVGNESSFRDISIELENIMHVAQRLQRAYSVEVTA
jgi:hypothetical protein